MRVVLIGGGKIGSFLARRLRDDEHVITVIEKDIDRAQRLSEEPGILVLEGDGTDIELLRDAGVARCDWMAAVTGLDEVNLVACELARTLGVDRVLARVNDPRNSETFEALEVPVISVTDIMVQVLTQELEVAHMMRVALAGRGQISMVQLNVPEGFVPTRVEKLGLTGPTVLAAIVRENHVFVPTASSELRAGDRILAVTDVEREADLEAALLALSGESPGPDEPHDRGGSTRREAKRR